MAEKFLIPPFSLFYSSYGTPLIFIINVIIITYIILLIIKLFYFKLCFKLFAAIKVIEK